tara:strand:- start:427 stop:741 length:315 start_codon:yes stop_codon:yes gene_type:complete
MATNKEIIKKLSDIEDKLPNGELGEMHEMIKEIKAILLDPEDGLIVRVNKNTYWRKALTESETNFDSVKDDVKDLNSFKNNVTKAMWIIYTAVSGLIIKLIWGD